MLPVYVGSVKDLIRSDHIFYRSYVDRQHFRLRFFASLCSIPPLTAPMEELSSMTFAQLLRYNFFIIIIVMIIINLQGTGAAQKRA